MADEQSENYKKALKAAEQVLGVQNEINKSAESFKETIGGMSKMFSNISGSDFFEKIPKTSEDLAESAKEIDNINEKLKTAGKSLNDGLKENFGSIRDSLKEFQNEDLSLTFEVNQDEISDFYKNTTAGQEELNDILKGYGKEWEEIVENHDKLLVGKFKEAVVQGDITKFLEEGGKSAKDLVVSLVGQENALSGQVRSYEQISKDSKNLIKNLKDSNKEIFTMNKILDKAGSNLWKNIIDSVMKFDSIISKSQKETGIAFKENSIAMGDLTRKTTAYGMSVQGAADMMGELGDQLSTTDFGILSKAASDFAAIEAATGVTSKEMTTIAGELMRAGVSSESIRESMEATNKQSQLLGVNSKRVIQQMEKNITKMREFGFTGGIESLREMAVEAERLRINVDDVFNVAKKARSIQGAMEMAAELQLAGGSFAAINPMDLLSAARKGPKEMQNILKTMGKDIGAFNDKTGEFQFDPVDVDRLQIVAESTGMSLDSLQKMIQKNAETAQKTQLFPPSMFDMPEVDKNMLAEMTDMKDGKLVVKSEFEDMAEGLGIKDISLMGPDDFKKLKDEREKRTKTLDQQAKDNASLADAFKRLTTSFMQIFTLFEPAISLLAKAISGVAEFVGTMGTFGKVIAGAGVMFLLASTQFTQALVKNLVPFGKSMTSFGSKMKDKVLNRSTSVSPLSGKQSAVQDKASKVKSGGGIAGFAKSIADASKEAVKIKMEGILRFAGSMAIIGAVLIGFGAAMAAFGGEASMNQIVTMGASLVILGGGLILFSKLSGSIEIGNIAKFALAMTIVGVGLLAFGYAMSLIQGVDPMVMLGMLGMMLASVVLLGVIGSMAMGMAPLLLAAAVVLVGAGLMMVLFASSLLIAAVAFERMAGIDWSGFSAMGDALLSVVPGLMGFSLAAMTFLNPLTLLGFVTMTGVLGLFAAIMIPLSDSLAKGADGFDRLAEGINTLKEATKNLDFDKLEKLADMSEGLAGASAMSNIASSLSNMSKNMGGGKSGGGGGSKTVTHIVNIKMNGREVQQLILDDTDMQK